MAADAHLDLGCGTAPRNPYGRAKLHGVDVRALTPAGWEFTRADLFLEPLPFPDGAFASVSAFDFFEHVPRVLTGADGRSTRFPFVELMSEIWRVLAPGGRLYAVTPAFPSDLAFIDPTHVNVITARTHEYFTGERPLGQAYGFTGRFSVVRAEWVVPKDAEVAAPRTLRQSLRLFHRRVTGQLTHFLWEFETIRPGAAS